MCGWGVFYSGLFIITIMIFIVRFTKYKFDEINSFFVLLIIISFFPSIFINCCNNARYWPFLFFFTPWLLYVVSKTNIYVNMQKAIYICISLLCLFSVIPAMGGICYKIIKTENVIRPNMKYMKYLQSEDKLSIYSIQPGVVYNLHDNQIYCKQQIDIEHNNYSILFTYSAIQILLNQE